MTVLLGCLTTPPSSERSNPNKRPPDPKLRYGIAPYFSENYSPASSIPKNVDIIVVKNWLLSEGAEKPQEEAIREILKAKKTPYIFSYIVADTVKKSLNTDRDCDRDSSADLCRVGAEKIRENFRSHILPTYIKSAKLIESAAQKNAVLVHIEPDWLQYTEHSQNKPLTKAESHQYRNEILEAVNRNCPSCRIVLDFSPWFDPASHPWAKSLGDYYGRIDRRYVQYIGLVGKTFNFSEGKIDKYTYAEMTTEMNLPLIVTSAYTFGGTPTPLDITWLRPEAVDKSKKMRIDAIILSLDKAELYEKFIANPQTPVIIAEQEKSGDNKIQQSTENTKTNSNKK